MIRLLLTTTAMIATGWPGQAEPVEVTGPDLPRETGWTVLTRTVADSLGETSWTVMTTRVIAGLASETGWGEPRPNGGRAQ